MWEVYGNSWVADTTVYDNAGNNNASVSNPAMSDGKWHTWQTDWVKGGGFTFFQDGAEYFSVSPSDVHPWPYDNKGNSLYMILNLALGGSGGGSVHGTTWPVEYLIDWVHCW